MTDYQNELVMEHLDLVNWVIRTRISVPNRPLLTYDDFYGDGNADDYTQLIEFKNISDQDK